MRKRHLILPGALAAVALATPAAALTFAFRPVDGQALAPARLAALQTAGAAWAAAFTDPVTVTLQVAFADLGPGVLANTQVANLAGGGSVWRNLIAAHATSADDTLAAATFATSSQSAYTVSTAQARALGFATPSFADDGTITFSSTAAFSLARNGAGGIAAGTYDFVGVAEHELGHVLGFISSLDGGIGSQTILDQFRWTAPGVRDVTAGDGTYFAIDGGATPLARFASGGSTDPEASHWTAANPSLMRPSLNAGEVENLTELDARALDVIGYTPAAVAADVPEPATWWTLLAGFGLVGLQARRARVSRPARARAAAAPGSR